MKYIVLSFLIVLMCSCNSYHADFPSCLVGDWKMDMDGINSEDKWTKINDTVYVCDSYLEGTKTENILLYKKNNDWYFVPTVFAQNNGEPVIFKLTEQNSNTFIFENKSHDFPERFIYHFRSAESLIVSLNGKGKQEDIYFLKQN